MDREYQSGAASAAPARPAGVSSGYPTNGDPATLVDPTVPGAWWHHMITEELLATIAGGGLTPDGETLTQVRDAMIAIANARAAAAVGALTIPSAPGDATESARGLVELATPAETIAGTDRARAVTPGTMVQRTATTSRRGLVELATSAEAAAGTDSTRAVTPAGIRGRVKSVQVSRTVSGSGPAVVDVSLSASISSAGLLTLTLAITKGSGSSPSPSDPPGGP